MERSIGECRKGDCRSRMDVPSDNVFVLLYFF